ncbi:MAG TPA: hypothetical protein DD714_00600 [Candidatus Omnitrophica bacterium]|nr:hypothetical protein [Candidatus Omnitrophota bacterium]
MNREALPERLKRWGYAPEINDRVKPILELAESGDIGKFEEAICTFTAQVLADLEAKSIGPREADALFMVLDLYITEVDLREKLRKEIQGLVMEGMLFHHYGDVHGPSIDLIRELIKKRLEGA